MENAAEKVRSEVNLDVKSFDEELFASDWARGWQQGRNDTMQNMQDNFLPRNDQVLRSAEIVVKLMVKKFGDVFGRIFAGFNSHYDEPAILLCLKDGVGCKRMDVVSYGVDVQPEFQDSGLIPLRVLVTRQNSTDFDTVAKEFQFERK